MVQKQQFCTFFVDGLFYGIEVEKVQEVLRHEEMTRVPLAPQAVSGLINLRGQIVTAIDLRRRLERSERPGDQRPLSVVVRTEEGPVSLLVDEVGDVEDLADENFERPPQTLRGPSRELIRGAYKLQDRLLLVLETDKVLNLSGP